MRFSGINLASGGDRLETVVIEISAVYKDRTKAGLNSSISGYDRLNKSIQKTQQQANKASNSMGDLANKVKSIAGKVINIPVKIIDYATSPLRKLYNFATSLKGVLTGLAIGQTFNQAISAPLSLADQYSSAKIGFETLFRSAEKAQKMMNDIDQFAIETPFNTSNVISNIQKMMAYGWDTSRLLTDMRTIGDAAAATGKGDEGLGSIVYALSEIRSKGKLSTQELNQLASAGIKAKAYLAQGLGYGTSDEGMMQLAADLEKGAIGANQAIDLILEGMKEFEGMMDKTANETVGGLKSQLSDMFEVNVARRWGQGLQDGAKRGLGTLATLLDENREKLAAFGDVMYNLGADVSNFLADKLEVVIKDLSELTRSAEFQNADLFGKVGLVWNKIIAEPFNKWWNGEGGAAFRAKATQIGESIGEDIANGAMKVFGQIVPSLFKNAGKLLPGGESADGSAVASGLALLLAGKSLGLGKLAGWGGSKLLGMLGSSGAAGAAGVSGTALLGVSSAAVAATGLFGAVNDLAEASESVNKKTKRDYQYKAGTKLGMIGAGAAIGSFFGPLGTLVGAGAGGLASLLFGGSVGEWLSDLSDGTAGMVNLGNSAEAAQAKLGAALTDANNFKTLVSEWKDVRLAFELVNETKAEAEQRIKETKDLIDGINTKQAALEVQINNAPTEDEKNRLLDLWALEETKRITLEASMTGNLVEGDANFLQLAIDAYEEQKQQLIEAGASGLEIESIDLHIKTMQYVIDQTNNEEIEKKIADLEKEEVELRSKILDPLASAEEKATWTERIKEIEEEGAKLRAQLKPISSSDWTNFLGDIEGNIVDLKTKLADPTLTPEERTRIETNLQTAEADYLTLKALIAGIENAEGFYSQLDALSEKVASASNGMISKWELMFSPLDEVEAKLKRIQEHLDGLAQQSRAELMLIVNEGRETHASTGDELARLKAEQPEASKLAEEYSAAAGILSKYKSSAELLWSERELAQDSAWTRYKNKEISQKEWQELDQAAQDSFDTGHQALLAQLIRSGDWAALGKLGDERVSSALEGLGFSKGTGSDWINFFDGVGDYFSDKESAYAQSVLDMAAQMKELQTAYDQYANAQIELIKTDKNKYGMTFDDYISKISSGDGVDMTPFIQMINDVFAAEAENPQMSEQYKHSMANIVGNIVEGMSEEFIKGYKGVEVPQEEVDTFAEYMNNALVAARDKLLGEKGVEDPISDVSEALANVGLTFTDVSAKAKSDMDTATTAVVTASGNISGSLGSAASAADGFASRVNGISFPSFFGVEKHANGTITNGPEIAEIGEDGTEFVIPVSGKYRARGLALWERAGRMLGVRQYAEGGVVGRQYVDMDSSGETASSSQPVTVEVGGVKLEVVVNGGDSETVLNTIRDNIHVLADEVAGEIGRAIPRVYANVAT